MPLTSASLPFIFLKPLRVATTICALIARAAHAERKMRSVVVPTRDASVTAIFGPSLFAMFMGVLFGCYNAQIIGLVIQAPIIVFMMNVLSRGQRSTKLKFDHMAMFVYPYMGVGNFDEPVKQPRRGFVLATRADGQISGIISTAHLSADFSSTRVFVEGFVKTIRTLTRIGECSSVGASIWDYGITASSAGFC